MLKNATTNGSLKGLKLHNSQPLTHQQFVDDNLLLAHPSIQEALHPQNPSQHLLGGLGSHYQLGQIPHLLLQHPPFTQRTISRTLGFASSSLPSKYLGAPLIASAIKHSTWKELIDKLTQRISSWTFRTLNLAGCLVLLKSILQTMSLYLFSVLAAPKWVLNSIWKIQCTFLWSGENNTHKWALVKWDTIFLPKNMGGLSLRDPIKSNETLQC
jgi:hypothetical protein